MRIRERHRWRLSYAEAVAIQEDLRRIVEPTPLPRSPRLVAGADVSYDRRTHAMHAVVVVLEIPSLRIVDRAHAVAPARWPYLPGLFSFRELPPLLEAFRSIETRPDVVLFDAHGVAHPRRFGVACHAGVLLELPTVGCAKSLLVGEHRPPGSARGARAPIVIDGERVGFALRTRAGVRPVYVSPGHLADDTSSAELVLSLATRYRLPEPLRAAHLETGKLRTRSGRLGHVEREHSYPDFLARLRRQRAGPARSDPGVVDEPT